MRFEFYGTIKAIKETENFKATDLRTFDSGWCIKTLKFNGFGGNSRYTFSIDHGYWGDKQGNHSEKNEVYTVDLDKNLLKVPYNQRFNEKYVSQVPFFKTFDIIDADGAQYNHLRNIVKVYEEGKHPSDESCSRYGIYSHEDAIQAFNRAKAGQKRYIYEGDFVERLTTMLNDGAFDGKHVRVTGEYAIRYSEQKGQFYKTFRPNKISVGEFAHEDGMFLFGQVLYGKDALEPIEGTNDYLANTFVRYYDNQYKTEDCKGWVACPLVLTLHAGTPAFPVLVKRFDKKFFGEGTQYRQWELELQYVDGAEVTEITEDDLSEEEKEDIACGLRDFEDIKKAHGGKVYGDRITEFRIYKTAGTPEDTEYKDVDFDLPTHKKAEEAKSIVNNTISTDGDDDDDLPFDI